MIIERYVNQLMTSNCYIVVDESSKTCVIIDPGSVESSREIEYIKKQGLTPEYIIISHEHTDHNWGVNALRDAFPSIRLICSEECSKNVAMANKAYFLFYYDDPTYSYEIAPAEILIKNKNESLEWAGHEIEFYLTPGHSFGSMCIKIGNYLFSGDTIMPYKPYFNGRDSNQDDWEDSIEFINKRISHKVVVSPGHGETLILDEWFTNYYN